MAAGDNALVTQEPERSHWSRWHDEYDDPRSRLSWRLGVVQDRLREALAAMPVGPVKVISLCAGQGRDVMGAVAGHSREGDVRAVLVEADRSNCDHARNAAISDGRTGVRIVCDDASTTSVVRDEVPANVLLLCGIFGNVSDEDVEHTVRNCSQLCAPGAWVIWTRHRHAPDLTVSIRDWFAESGFREVAFDVQDDDTAAVGTQRLAADPLPFTPDLHLFTFNR
jgi:hypothetical protein